MRTSNLHTAAVGVLILCVAAGAIVYSTYEEPPEELIESEEDESDI